MTKIYKICFTALLCMCAAGFTQAFSQFTGGEKISPRGSYKTDKYQEFKRWKPNPSRSLNEYLCTFVDPIPENYPADSLDVLFNRNFGFYAGTNAFGDKQKGNFYDLSFFDFSEVTDVIFAAYVDVPDSSKSVTVRIYDGTTGSPGTLLGSAPVTLREIADSFDIGRYVDVEFTTPVQLPVSKKIFITVDFSNLSILSGKDEYFGLISTKFDVLENLAWEQWADDSWHSFSEESTDGSTWNDSLIIELYPVVCGDIVTPVKLNHFSANPFGIANKLEWTTETESANKGFEIERSEDGVNFTSIGFVSSKAPGGNSSAMIHYAYIDESPLPSNNFYRVKQVDLNSKASFSKTQLVVRDKLLKGGILSVYPNPAKTFLNLVISLRAGSSDVISITDLAGRAIIRKQIEGSNSNQNIRLNVSSLPKGTYFVKTNSTNGNNVLKFVKE